VVAVSVPVPECSHKEDEISKTSWYKGCLHAHSTESDGDESPEKVARWFQDYGYDWLVLSDHNVLTVLDTERPLMISGEEVTVKLEGEEKAVYVNGVGISRVVEPVNAGDVLATVQASVNGILEAGGMASLCAPYIRPGFDHESLKEIEGARLMEVFNAHPSNVLGDPRTFSYEDIWDLLLSKGKVVYGTATDDAHHYQEFGADKANPGRGWVVARAPELTQDAILESIRSGDFYCSTGVSLTTVEASRESISLAIDPGAMQSYTTTFIGRGGVKLTEETGPEASYSIQGDEGYVRARVDSSAGARAWTQPVFTE
jgi:hypothetical protein